MALLDDLLAFDDHPELSSFRLTCRRVRAWPVIRWQIYRKIIEAELGWQPAIATSEPRTLRQRLDFAARAISRNPLRVARRFEQVIFGSGAGIVMKRDGMWFDRINDYFAIEDPEQTLVIDAAVRGSFKHPRFPPHTRCHDAFLVAANAASRMRRVEGVDEATIGALLRFVGERLDIASSLDHARDHLRYWATSAPVLASLYDRFFSRVRPRVIFVEDGHYGGRTPLLLSAHDAGIATAELQHGLVARAHIAYNYGEKLRRDPDFARHLPRHFLVWGEYWARQVATPAEVVVIGAPHFAARAHELATRPRPARRSILIISQGDCTDRMVALTHALAARLPERQFVFRLHPAEVPFVERYQSLSSIATVRISDRGDLYDCLAEADAVVGPASTALLEADGCGIPVFVDDDRSTQMFLPAALGSRFQTAEQLVALLGSRPAMSSSVEGLWAEGWQRRYRTFLDRFVR